MKTHEVARGALSDWVRGAIRDKLSFAVSFTNTPNEDLARGYSYLLHTPADWADLYDYLYWFLRHSAPAHRAAPLYGLPLGGDAEAYLADLQERYEALHGYNYQEADLYRYAVAQLADDLPYLDAQLVPHPKGKEMPAVAPRGLSAIWRPNLSWTLSAAELAAALYPSDWALVLEAEPLRPDYDHDAYAVPMWLVRPVGEAFAVPRTDFVNLASSIRPVWD